MNQNERASAVLGFQNTVAIASRATSHMSGRTSKASRATVTKRLIILAFTLGFAVAGVAYAKETGTTRVAVDLMATPYSDAKPAGKLPSNTTVDVLERRGGWLRISAKGKTGWARLHQVRAGEGPETKATGGGLAALKNVSQTGRSGSQGIVATTGIRGLSAEELKSAKPNPKAVKSMETHRASDNSARDFARSAGLKEKDVPFLSQE